MTKTRIVQHLLKQSPFLAFSKDDLRKIEDRYKSTKFVHVRLGYQWSDAKGKSRKSLTLGLRDKLRVIFEQCKLSVPKSKHQLIYASLRAQGGRPVLHKIVLDVVSSDVLFFDITYSNPNVFFELGIAYATNKNVFLLLEKGTDTIIPSDLAGLTFIRYTWNGELDLDSYAEKDISNVLKVILKQKLQVNDLGS